MLADFEIRKAIQDDWIDIDPYDETRLQPVSYDVALGNNYRVFRPDIQIIETYDIGDHYMPDGHAASWNTHTTAHTLPAHGHALRPGDFLLACTTETIRLSPGIAARVEGKSSLGRLGVLVHATAGFIDPGFAGQITLEITNVGPAAVMLHPGMPIAQLTFEPVSAPERDYSQTGHYQGQTGPTESRYRFRR